MQYQSKINCAGYVRCSTDQQDDSIAQQKLEIEKFTKTNNLKIVRWYEDEGKSGTSFDKRAGFMKLKEDIENNPDFKFVLVYDESRWGRAVNPRENNFWKMYFESNGIKVKIINSQSSNGNDLASCIIEAMESAQASAYSTNLSQVTLRGQKSNAIKGYSNGGTAPYGYKRVAVDKQTNKYVRDLQPGQHSNEDEKVIFALGSPDEIRIVKKIFDLRLEGFGFRAIANFLNKEKVPCPKRGRWKNRDQKWSFNTVNSILSNPIYTGAMVFNRHPQSHLTGPSKNAWINDEKYWVIKKNAHPSIIKKEVFEQANKSRKAYSRNNRYFYESPYLLSGLLVCKRCGFNFQGQTRNLKSKRNGLKTETHAVHYYLDGGYAGKGKSVCSPNLLRKHETESVIIKHIIKSINIKEFITKVIKVIQSKLRNNNNQEQEVKELTNKIEKCNKSLKNLVNMVDNGIDIKEVREEILNIQKEREFSEKELFRLKNEVFSERDISNLVKKVELLISDFEQVFRNSPAHIQKKLIRSFVTKVEVDPDNDTINYYIRNVPWIDDKLGKRFEFGTMHHKTGLHPFIKADRRNAHIASTN